MNESYTGLLGDAAPDRPGFYHAIPGGGCAKPVYKLYLIGAIEDTP